MGSPASAADTFCNPINLNYYLTPGKIYREAADPVIVLYNNDYYLFASKSGGYLTEPATGSCTFWVASDDDSELWLSLNDQSINAVRIATVSGWTGIREWNRLSSQKSAAVTLTSGLRY